MKKIYYYFLKKIDQLFVVDRSLISSIFKVLLIQQLYLASFAHAALPPAQTFFGWQASSYFSSYGCNQLGSPGTNAIGVYTSPEAAFDCEKAVVTMCAVWGGTERHITEYQDSPSYQKKCLAEVTPPNGGINASYIYAFAKWEMTGEPNPNNGEPNCGMAAGSNPINVGTGNKFQAETDYVDPRNLLSLVRFYNSKHEMAGGFSGQWVHSLQTRITKNGYLTVWRSDGKPIQFSGSGANWVSRNGFEHRLSAYVIDGGSQEWNYIYTGPDNISEIFSSNGALLSRQYPSGEKITVEYYPEEAGTQRVWILPSIVTDSYGRKLIFHYDFYKRIDNVALPDGGSIKYSYSNNLLSSVTYPDSKTRIYVYNEPANTSGTALLGALTGIIDENGNRFATYKYDALGRAVSSEHNLPSSVPVEKVSIAYTTDTNGTVTSSAITDAFNTTRTYSFTNILGVAKITGVSQPCSSGCGAASATTYDANGNISSKTDFNGNITNYIYDLTRNLETSRTEAYGTPQARTITTQWHTTYRLPTLITEPGKTTAFGYDTSGNLLTKTITDTALSNSRTWTYTYNSLGQVLTADGPRTDVVDKTTNTYYSSASSVAGSVHSIGDLATVTNALGQVTSITNYDLSGRPLTITDPNGVVTTLTYDPRGRLKTRTVAGVQTTAYDYDGVGQLTKVTLPDASYLSYTYDTAHRLTDITDNAGNKTHYTLDAMSNRIQEDTKDPSGNILKTRSRIFDALNRLQKDIGGTTPTTQITQYGYDNNGNLKTVTDPLNHITTNGYDALNRLITVTDPANGVSTTTYNALDQVTKVKDPRLVTTDYTINALGDVTLTASPDSGNTNKVYDLAGNVTQKTDARGVVSNYTYDALNRVTAITYPANTAENVTFTYDSTTNGNKGIGKLTFYGNDGGSTVLVYDSYGNVITQTEMIGSQFYVTAYQYDNVNRLSQITSPSGRIITYTRNALGQITQVQTKENATAAAVTIISNATYEPFGPIKTLTYGNGVVTTVQHDADYRTSRITASSTPVWDYQYSYDAAGNLLQQTDQVGTISKTFGYDALDRVTTDTNNTGNWTYQYDAAGNRTKRIWVNTSNATSTQTLTYATSSNRITKNGSSTQTLDAAGNITGNGQTLAYNNANHLSLVSSGSTVKAGFRYNALNQRTSKLQITKPMDFHYGLGGQISGLTAYNPTVLYQRNDYIWLDDIPVAQTRIIYNSNGSVNSRRTTYVHADHLNTPRAMTDSTGKLVWRWDGDAYASQKPNENPDGDGTTDTLNLRFPGQFFDAETGFIYNWNRYYDPATGRYTQSDPIGLNGGLNTYGYVGGRPINDVDPTGQNPLLQGVAVVGTVWAVYKFANWCSDASSDAEKAQQANQAAQDALTAMMNGQPYNPSDIQAAKNATQQSLNTDAQVVNNLPPGTTATPFDKVNPRSR